MKEIILSTLLVFACVCSFAQIPNFGSTAGDQKIYGYTSVKYRVNEEKNCMPDWQTYSTLQYGVTDYQYLTLAGAILGCVIACYIPYRPLLNVIYGLNGYLGFILVAFMIVNDIKVLRNKK